MDGRVADLRAHALRSQRGPDPEAERLRQESLAETEGEPAVLREARAFAHYCRNRTVVIHEGELIVGSQSSMQHDPSTPTTPRIFNRQTLTCPWPVPDDLQLLFREGLLSGAGNHTTMDYETILAVGFLGLRDRIRQRLASLSPDGQDAEEKHDFLEALEFKPDQPYVLNYLGYSWIEKRMNLDRAQDMVRKAVSLRPHDGYIVDSLGWVYYQLGDFEKAVSELERAVELRPEDPVINDHLGDAYWRVGRHREARFQWRRSVSLGPESEIVDAVRDKIKNGMADPVTAEDNGGNG